jgi:hypothetical protein
MTLEAVAEALVVEELAAAELAVDEAVARVIVASADGWVTTASCGNARMGNARKVGSLFGIAAVVAAVAPGRTFGRPVRMAILCPSIATPRALYLGLP